MLMYIVCVICDYLSAKLLYAISLGLMAMKQKYVFVRLEIVF